jgi:hypothetical protein
MKGQIMSGLLGIVVPEPIQFLNWGWLIIHVVGIAVVFFVGMMVGKKRAG